jgi:hypothetical protein
LTQRISKFLNSFSVGEILIVITLVIQLLASLIQGARWQAIVNERITTLSGIVQKDDQKLEGVAQRLSRIEGDVHARFGDPR